MTVQEHLALRCPRLSAIDVTVRSISECLVLILGTAQNFTLRHQAPYAHTSTIRVQEP